MRACSAATACVTDGCPAAAKAGTTGARYPVGQQRGLARRSPPRRRGPPSRPRPARSACPQACRSAPAGRRAPRPAAGRARAARPPGRPRRAPRRRCRRSGGIRWTAAVGPPRPGVPAAVSASASDGPACWTNATRTSRAGAEPADAFGERARPSPARRHPGCHAPPRAAPGHGPAARQRRGDRSRRWPQRPAVPGAVRGTPGGLAAEQGAEPHDIPHHHDRGRPDALPRRLVSDLPSVVVRTRCRGVVPSQITATGVSASRPRFTSSRLICSSRPTAISSTRVPGPCASAAQSTVAPGCDGSRCADTTAKSCVMPRWVTGIPALAGTATALVTPGTTVTGTPARAQASASSPPRPKTNGSPPLSRTTRWPASARLISTWLIWSWVSV